jgi:hypothetical protein
MLAGYVEPILLLTGLLTAGALSLLLAPGTLLKSLFGHQPADPLGVLIARQWGLLVFLVGALLVWAAYHSEVRDTALIIAAVEKVFFALSVFLSPFRRHMLAACVAVADTAMATLYILILVGM